MKGKMRKILVAFLALILVLNLAACGGGSSQEPGSTDTPATQSPSSDEGTGDTGAETSIAVCIASGAGYT